jgi:hypothetical protein
MRRFLSFYLLSLHACLASLVLSSGKNAEENRLWVEMFSPTAPCSPSSPSLPAAEHRVMMVVENNCKNGRQNGNKQSHQHAYDRLRYIDDVDSPSNDDENNDDDVDGNDSASTDETAPMKPNGHNQHVENGGNLMKAV